MFQKFKNLITRKRIIAFVLIVSIGANAYYFGFQSWFKKEKSKAFNNGVIYVFQQAQKLGKVGLEINGEIVNLIYEKK